MSAAERASETSSAKQANEWAVQANERMEGRMAQYSTCRLLTHSNHRALSSSFWLLPSLFSVAMSEDGHRLETEKLSREIERLKTNEERASQLGTEKNLEYLKNVVYK